MSAQESSENGDIPSPSWAGRKALVTGATTGIGEAIAYALADMGLLVVLVGRRTSELEQVARNVDRRGGSAQVYTCDLGNAEASVAMFAALEASDGGLDVLINNAGLGYKAGVSNFDTADLRQMLDVNVFGASICIREALRLLGHRPGTAIITISSMAAHRIPPGGFGFYAASKHALRAIMEALRVELVEMGSPTKVGSISSGTVATGFHKLFARSDSDPTSALPFERLTPEDIAAAVTYMLNTPDRVQVNDILIRPMGQLG